MDDLLLTVPLSTVQKLCSAGENVFSLWVVCLLEAVKANSDTLLSSNCSDKESDSVSADLVFSTNKARLQNLLNQYFFFNQHKLKTPKVVARLLGTLETNGMAKIEPCKNFLSVNLLFARRYISYINNPYNRSGTTGSTTGVYPQGDQRVHPPAFYNKEILNKTISPPARTCESKQNAKEEEKERKVVGELTTGSVACEWQFYLKRKHKNGTPADSLEQAEAQIENLIQMGVPLAAISEEISRTGRDRTEFFDSFKERLLKSHGISTNPANSKSARSEEKRREMENIIQKLNEAE